jgi:hypothetical protein
MADDQDNERNKERLDAVIQNSRGKSWAKQYPKAWRAYRDELLEKYGSDTDAMEQAIDRQFPDRKKRLEIQRRLETEIENPRWRSWIEAHPKPSQRYISQLITTHGSDMEAMEQAIDHEFSDRAAELGAEKAERAKLRAEVFRADGKPFSERVTSHRIRRIASQRAGVEHARQKREATEQTVGGFLSGLPEFQESTPTRVLEVSQQLVEALSPEAGKVR